eukprot:10876067-Alexandrium_andersonii.AAC.1
MKGSCRVGKVRLFCVFKSLQLGSAEKPHANKRGAVSCVLFSVRASSISFAAAYMFSVCCH